MSQTTRLFPPVQKLSLQTFLVSIICSSTRTKTSTVLGCMEVRFENFEERTPHCDGEVLCCCTGGWFPDFRLYGPEKTFFDKTWKLPDFEHVR